MTQLRSMTFLMSCLALCGCKASISEAPQAASKVLPKIEAYASAVIDEFYDYELDGLLERAGPSSAISIDALEALADSAHETAQPQNKALRGYTTNSRSGSNGGGNSASLEYFIPNAVGGERLSVSLSYTETTCCQLIRLEFKTPKKILGATD